VKFQEFSTWKTFLGTTVTVAERERRFVGNCFSVVSVQGERVDSEYS
jgi:hypothetical protein